MAARRLAATPPTLFPHTCVRLPRSYLLTLGALYLAVRAGALGTLDVAGALAARLPASVKDALFGPGDIAISPALLDFGTAWLLTKTTEPLRLVATLALVPALRKRAPLPLLRLLRAVPAARKEPAAR